MALTWNGKKVSKKEMDKILSDSNTKVEQVSISMKPEKKEAKHPLTDEGVAISKEYTQAILKKMIESNATYAKTSFTHVPGLMGKNLVIIITDNDVSEVE